MSEGACGSPGVLSFVSDNDDFRSDSGCHCITHRVQASHPREASAGRIIPAFFQRLRGLPGDQTGAHWPTALISGRRASMLLWAARRRATGFVSIWFGCGMPAVSTGSRKKSHQPARADRQREVSCNFISTASNPAIPGFQTRRSDTRLQDDREPSHRRLTCSLWGAGQPA